LESETIFLVKMDSGLSPFHLCISRPKAPDDIVLAIESTSQGKPQPFNDLPIDLLWMIVEYLSPADKLCLALTCKSLQSILNPDRELSGIWFFHHHVPIFPASVIDEDIPVFSRPRWRLLRQLEDSRWMCCSGCHRLHPVNAFSRTQRRKIAELRTCIFRPKVVARVVHLCPDVQLTYQDRLKLMQTLATPDATTPGGAREAWSLSPHSETIWHKCTHEYHGTRRSNISVQVSMSPRIENGSLIMEAQYDVRGNSWPTDFMFVPYRLCPHRNLSTHVQDMCLTDIRGYRPPRSSRLDPRMVACEECLTEIRDVFHQFQFLNDHTSFECLIHVKRYLGPDEGEATYEWYRNTDAAYNNFSAGAWPPKRLLLPPQTPL
jgi:hypothetical protein